MRAGRIELKTKIKIEIASHFTQYRKSREKIEIKIRYTYCRRLYII